MNFTTTPPSGSNGGSSAASADSQGSVAAAVDVIGPDKDDIVTTTTGVADAVHPATVTFAQPIEPQSLRIDVRTTVGAQGTESPADTSVAGTLSYNPATQTASFQPDAPLRPGSVYRAVATATGPNGKAIAPIDWTFREALPGSAAPAHLPTLPATGQTPRVVALSTEGDSWRRTDPLPPTDV